MSGAVVVSEPTPAWSNSISDYSVKSNSGADIGPCYVNVVNVNRSYLADGSTRNDVITILDGRNGPVMFRLETGWCDDSNPYNFASFNSFEIPGDGIYFGVGPWVSSSSSSNHGLTPNTFTLICTTADPAPVVLSSLDTHDGFLIDKRDEYARIIKEIERKNRKQFNKEQTERDRRKAELQEINAKYQRFLELRDKYLKSKQ